MTFPSAKARLLLSRVFRGKFLAGLRRAFRNHQLVFYGECLPLADEKHFTVFLRSSSVIGATAPTFKTANYAITNSGQSGSTSTRCSFSKPNCSSPFPARLMSANESLHRCEHSHGEERADVVQIAKAFRWRIVDLCPDQLS